MLILPAVGGGGGGRGVFASGSISEGFALGNGTSGASAFSSASQQPPPAGLGGGVGGGEASPVLMGQFGQQWGGGMGGSTAVRKPFEPALACRLLWALLSACLKRLMSLVELFRRLLLTFPGTIACTLALNLLPKVDTRLRLKASAP